jgi:hypothetical protein
MAVSSKRLYNWYCAVLAALCMVLYGYDASVFNSVQGSDNWLEWVNLDPKKDTYMLGLSEWSRLIGLQVMFRGPRAIARM